MQCGPYKALAVFLESADFLLGTLNKNSIWIFLQQCCAT